MTGTQNYIIIIFFYYRVHLYYGTSRPELQSRPECSHLHLLVIHNVLQVHLSYPRPPKLERFLPVSLKQICASSAWIPPCTSRIGSNQRNTM